MKIKEKRKRKRMLPAPPSILLMLRKLRTEGRYSMRPPSEWDGHWRTGSEEILDSTQVCDLLDYIEQLEVKG